MKQHIIELIQEKDHKKILDWAKRLTDKDRYASIDLLMKLDSDEIITEPRPKQFNQEYADKHHLVRRVKGYMTICCVRSAKDLSLTVPDLAWNKSDSVLHSCFRNSSFEIEPLVEYFKLFPPDYLDKIVAKNAKERQFNNNFRILWSLYKNGCITFDEETFVRSLFIIPMSHRKPMDDVQFLSENKEAVTKVLLQFYKYEIPILDISKWNGKTEFHCAKCTEYWDEVFSELLSINLLDDRSILRNLLGTLSYNWKKAHLDWHIRMIKLFNPTKEEYFANQDLLPASLYATSNSVCNYVINTVESLYKDKEFDAETFLQNIPSLFVKEKSDKTILSALDIISYLLENNKDLQKQADIIAGALVQPNDQIQEKAARLLVKFIDKNNLEQVVEPFASSLKQKARDILSIEKTETKTSAMLALDHYLLVYPTSWEDFLFHIGKTLGSQDASDIDIMYESFIQLQDQMPDDYVSQLKPFTKKLEKASSEKELLVYIAEFFDNWLSGKSKYKPSDRFYSYKEHPIPFLRNRNQWVLSKLKRKSKLSLLSSPTHFPFYIHPEILVFRLSEYEKAGETVELEDLIVACNRILKTTLSDETKKQALKLKGNYAKAIHYLLGLSTEIAFENETLPLWTQVVRTVNNNGVFPEFNKITAKDYPTVQKPFILSYEISREYSDTGEYHWDFLKLEHNWSNSWHFKETKKEYPPLFFYTGHMGYDYYSMNGFKYILTLMPHYADAFILRNLPNTATGNEVTEFEYCLYPLQFLFENQIAIHHSGWLYIACCLIFEKKSSRQLAAEYINLAFDLSFVDPEYLANCIADMIVNKFAPVNRLIEYFDQPYPVHIKEFQLLIIEKCIEKANKDALPTNFKKISAYYDEIKCSLP